MSDRSRTRGSLGLGPVSDALEREVRDHVRKNRVSMWLDSEGRYTGFVERLVAARAVEALPYEVRAFRGSFLELMMELAPLSSGVDPSHVIVHLPGFTEESIKDTPLLELYRLGKRFRKGLDTLVTEAAARRVPPERIAELVAAPDLTLEAADTWLARELDGSKAGLGPILAATSPLALVDDLLRNQGIAQKLDGCYDELFAHFEAALGLPTAWRERTFPGEGTLRSDAAYAAASWALGVEYVHDLGHPPRTERLAAATGLPAAVVEACRQLAQHLRAVHGDFYEQTARHTQQALLEAEWLAARAADLGKIDTFPFEDEVVLDEALEALREGRWAEADGWARQRIEGRSFWLERRPSRKSEWQLVGAAAALGLAIERAGKTLGAKTVDGAAERYVELGAAVDRAHRHLEQLRHALLYAQLDRFEELRAILDAMREHWRAWADAWARGFSALCQSEGFLPSPALRQRTLFEEVVQPLTAQGPTALFMVDALRFEMGQELFEAMAGARATEARLGHRLAELPSNTEVGMNVLAPVAQNGRLVPAVRDGRFVGFSAGEFRVSTPDTRKRAMQDRIGGMTLPWLTLEEVLGRGAASLKSTVSKARLVVVHSEEIDKAGERDLGPKVFDQVLGQLRTAWRLLHDAGVKHFVITADHGFLLLHHRATHAQPHGRKIDPARRHVLSPVAADHAGEVRVPLADLGYDGVEDLQLIFPETTAAFDVGERGSGFVHGGNSLEERVIPVLTVVHRSAAGGSSLRYRVDARREPGSDGMHCLRLAVEVASQEALPFARESEVELALRVKDELPVDVDLLQARGGARITGSTVCVPVGREAYVFFRLHGPTDARVQVEVFHPAAAVELESCTVMSRFEVAADGQKKVEETTKRSPGWLVDLPEPVRDLFAHLADHGTVSEAEATRMLGGPRQLRRFSARFEEYAARAPFRVRIEMVGGVRTYVREGTSR